MFSTSPSHRGQPEPRRPAARTPLAAVPPSPAASPPPSQPPHGGPERRRHRRGFLSRLLTRPVSATALEDRARVGAYDVTSAGPRLPGSGDARHWLIVGWMEGADLAVCNFRFSGEATDLSPDEAVWGSMLLERILTPDNFQSEALPPVRLRANI